MPTPTLILESEIDSVKISFLHVEPIALHSCAKQLCMPAPTLIPESEIDPVNYLHVESLAMYRGEAAHDL